MARRRIGLIGLGSMGRGMGKNLIGHGFPLTVYDANPAAVEPLVGLGASGAETPRAVAERSDVVVTVLPNGPDVEAVAFGDEGIYATAKPGTLHIDCSTIRPDVARQLAAAGAERGIRVVDAPVSGGEAAAKEGTLSIMVGGEAADVEAARPILEAVGSTIVHVGPAGSGQIVKAANQLIVAGTIQLVAEALVFLEAHGVDTAAAFEVLAGGLAGNRILDRKGASMRDREFTPGFRVELHHKDLGIALRTAREVGVPLPVTALVDQMLQELRVKGRGELDHSAVISVIEDAAAHKIGDETEGLS